MTIERSDTYARSMFRRGAPYGRCDAKCWKLASLRARSQGVGVRYIVITSAVVSLMVLACSERPSTDSLQRADGGAAQATRNEALQKIVNVSGDAGDSGTGADGDAVDEAWPGPEVETMPWQEVMALDGTASTSIGAPNEGRIEGGIPFPLRAPGVLLNPRRFNDDGHFGTVEMIQALIKAAAVVDREFPGGPPLIINDLGYKQGGPLPHHGSHQAGRDVDVLFYMLDEGGAPQRSKCVSLNLEGEGWDFLDQSDPEDDEFFKLDAKRSWRFLQALAEEEETTVQRVFVAEHIRTLLLAEADRVKAPRKARELVEAWTCQPGSPHDDHFHIRFFCTAEDIRSGCQDSTPMYPWRVEQLRAEGVSPTIWRRTRPRRRRGKGDLVERAIAKAGPMHEKVKAFLRERKAWRRPPRTGRPFCP